MAVVNEVVTKFSFKGSLEPLAKFNAGLKTVVKQSARMATALAGATTGAAVWASKQLEGVEAMANFARAQGVGVEALQKLRYAATQDGGTVETLDASIAGLNQRLGQFAATGAGRAKLAIEALGLSIQDSNGQMRPTVDILKDIAEKMKGMEQSKRIGLAYQLGIDKSLINMLEGGADGLDRLMADAEQWGIISQAQAETAATLSSNIDNLRHGIGVLGQRVAISMIPVLGDLQGQFKALLQDSDSWLNKGLRKIGPIMESAVGAIKRLMPIIVALGAAWAVSFAPMLLTAAAIAAVVLIIDDLIVAFQGGESVIAQFFDSFGVDIRPALHDFATWVQDMSSQLLAIGKQVLPGLVTSLKEAFAAIILAGKAVFAALGPIFASLVPILGETIKNVKALFKTIEHLFGFIGSFLQGDMNGMLYNLGGVMVWLGALFGGVIRGIAALAKGVIKGIGGIIRSMLPEALSGAIEDMTAFFVGFLDLVTSLLTGDFSRAWDMVKDIAQAAVDMIADMFRGLWDTIKEIFAGAGEFIWRSIRGVLPDWIKGPISILGTEAVYPDESDLSQPARGIPTAAALAGIPVEAVMPSLPIFESAPSQVSRSTTVNQDVTIHIASTEPQQAGKAVQRGLQDQLQQAQMMAARGGA